MVIGLRNNHLSSGEATVRKEKSVFAGVPRNSLSYRDIIHMSKGGEIHVKPQTRFFKSFIHFNITIKHVNLSSPPLHPPKG